MLHLSDYRCRITANCQIALSDHKCREWFVKTESAYAPIAIKEFVMVMINNGNRTEYSPIRSVIIRVINKIGGSRSGSPICQSRVWLQTELDEKKFSYQLITTVSISENNNYI